MLRSIAIVSVSGTLDEKLKAIAAAHFTAIELFETDLINFNKTPRQVRLLASDLGLAIDLYQPFRDFEAISDDAFRRNLDRAERKFDVCAPTASCTTEPIQASTSTSSPRASKAGFSSKSPSG